jgi:hypothetical protein
MALGTRELTVMHRRQQLALRKATIAQMEKLWPALDWADLDRTYPGFAAEVAALVSKNRSVSSGLAAAYLRAFRVASGLSGDVRIVVPPMPPEQFKIALRVTSLVAAKKSAALLVPAEVAMTNALTQASGSMARLVLNGGRETVTETIRNDTDAVGWRRVLGGGGCDFCKLLAGRVYPRDNADFDAHDRCGCSSEPVYRA